MRKRILIILFCLCGLMRAQVAINYYPFQSIFSISSNPDRLLWADYKIETNTFASNLNMEFAPKINIKRQEVVNYYLGPGIAFNPLYSFAQLKTVNGYFFDFGVRVKPFQRSRNFHFVFELSPYVNRELRGGNLRTRLGISYNFLRKKYRSGSTVEASPTK